MTLARIRDHKAQSEIAAMDLATFIATNQCQFYPETIAARNMTIVALREEATILKRSSVSHLTPRSKRP